MKDSIQVYIDTSVFGGVFDSEFAGPSRAFFDEIRYGRFQASVSTVVIQELRGAPAKVRDFYATIETEILVNELSEASIQLMEAYISSGIVGERWRADALHVAAATVSRCQAIVSWNFKHIVHFDKISLYNNVNLKQGYGALAIHTPQEMVHYED